LLRFAILFDKNHPASCLYLRIPEDLSPLALRKVTNDSLCLNTVADAWEKGRAKEHISWRENVEGLLSWHIKFEEHFTIAGTRGSASRGPFGARLSTMKGTIDVEGEAFLDQRDFSIVSVTVTTSTRSSIPVRVASKNLAMNSFKSRHRQRREAGKRILCFGAHEIF
jgi:hypothetical protein